MTLTPLVLSNLLRLFLVFPTCVGDAHQVFRRANSKY